MEKSKIALYAGVGIVGWYLLSKLNLVGKLLNFGSDAIATDATDLVKLPVDALIKTGQNIDTSVFNTILGGNQGSQLMAQGNAAIKQVGLAKAYYAITPMGLLTHSAYKEEAPAEIVNQEYQKQLAKNGKSSVVTKISVEPYTNNPIIAKSTTAKPTTTYADQSQQIANSLAFMQGLEAKGISPDVATQIWRKRSGLTYNASLIPAGY